MDIIEFHELMRNKYAERRWRQHRALRIWVLCNAALVTFLSSFVLAYLRYAGK